METSILNPDSPITLSNGNNVTVKLLRWKKALAFFEKLKTQLHPFLSEDGSLKLDRAKIMDAVQGNAELLEWLVLECTGKESAWLEEINLGDMAKLATRALEINLGALASEIKNVKGRLATLAGAPSPKLNETSPNSVSA
jgi:hypothetical protein